MTSVAGLSSRDRWGLRIGCAIVFAASVGLMAWYWPGGLPEDNASGVWTALAQDFARGVFYRPPADAFGFGGTRYMPMFFVLHAGLIRATLDAVTAGIVLMIISVTLLDLATLCTLLELGLDWTLALPLALLPHAAVAFQVLTVQIKGDFLAAAFVMWGVYCAVRFERRGSPGALVACVLVLFAAFLTKFTTLGSAFIVCAWLYGAGRRRAAAVVGGAVAALSAVAALLIDRASDGRAFASFAAVASGGSRMLYALGAPLWFLRSAVQDPVFVLIIGVAAYYAMRRPRQGRPDFVVVYFLGTAALTLFIFTSPGTDWNHFLELLGGATLVLGAELHERPRDARLAVALPGGLALVTCFSLLPGMISVKSVIEHNGKPERWQIGSIAARLGPGAHDLLSEDPIVPIVLGDRPVVLDPFNLRLLAAQRPEVARAFERRMANHEFGAVILVDFSASDRFHLPEALASCTASNGAPCYGGVVFPRGFLRELERDYVLSFIERPFVVYTPRMAVALGN